MAIENYIILMKLSTHVTEISSPKNTIRASDFVNMVLGMWHGVGNVAWCW